MWFYLRTQEDLKSINPIDYGDLEDYLMAERVSKKVLNNLALKEIKNFEVSVNKEGAYITYSCFKDDFVATIYYIAGIYAGMVGKATASIGPLFARADLGDTAIEYTLSPEDGKKIYNANEDEQNRIIRKLIDTIQGDGKLFKL